MPSDFRVISQRLLQQALASVHLSWGVDSTRPWNELAGRSALAGFHSAVARSLSPLGFKRDLRRRGELRFALWRLPLAKRSHRGFMRPVVSAVEGQECAPDSLLNSQVVPGLVARPDSRRRVLWIPGWGDTPVSWLPLAIAATRGLGVDELVILDFPGFHGSLAHSRCITEMDRFFELTADLVREFRPETLVGHSLGGWLAARAALLAEIPPKRLLLMAPSGVCWSGDYEVESELQARNRWREEFEAVVAARSAEEYGRFLFAKTPPGWSKLGQWFVPFLKREDTTEFLASVRDDHYLERLIQK